MKGMGTVPHDTKDGAAPRSRPDAVVFVTSVSRGILGGIVQYLDPLERLLPQHGVRTVTLHYPSSLNLVESRGMPKLVRVPLHLLFAVYSLARVLRLRRRHRVILVHSHGASYALLASFLAGVMGHPTAHTFHSMIRKKSFVIRAFAPKLDALVFVSESLHDRMRTLFPIRGRRVGYIPGAIDTVAFAPPGPGEKARLRAEVLAKYGLPDRSLLCVFVGRVVPEKGVLDLVEAAGILKDRGTPTGVLIVGPALAAPPGQGYDARIRERVRSLGVSDRVALAGAVAHSDVGRLLSGADVFVCPSLADAYPISVLEALSTGLPVVATRVGGLAEQVREGQTGILVAPGHPAELAAAIDRLVRSDPLRAQMGTRARQEALLHAGEESLLRRHLDLYSQILGARTEP